MGGAGRLVGPCGETFSCSVTGGAVGRGDNLVGSRGLARVASRFVQFWNFVPPGRAHFFKHQQTTCGAAVQVQVRCG